MVYESFQYSLVNANDLHSVAMNKYLRDKGGFEGFSFHNAREEHVRTGGHSPEAVTLGIAYRSS